MPLTQRKNAKQKLSNVISIEFIVIASMYTRELRKYFARFLIRFPNTIYGVRLLDGVYSRIVPERSNHIIRAMLYSATDTKIATNLSVYTIN